MQIDRTEAIARLQLFAKEGRIIRGQWHSVDAQGRETACLLGSLHPSIDSAAKCPGEIMPAWLAEMSPLFDDNTSEKAWPAIIARYADLASRWHVLNESAWRRCMAVMMIAALDVAQHHDKANVVAPVSELLGRVVAGDEPASYEWEAAAWSARAAAEAAAWSARAAAEAAAEAEAARAAEAAAWSARAAAEAAAEAAADAARAAWDTIATACLDAIEDEIATASKEKTNG